MKALKSPLTNLQLELLKLFARDVPDQDLLEIKRILTNYFAEKAMDEADQIWEKKGWTAKDVDRLSKTRMRTPYKS